MSSPTFTVVVPAYNAEETIARAIVSVISQTYSDWELIIVDDGSCDSTYEYAKQYADENDRIRCIRKKNGGTASALNAGIKEGKGTFVIHLDSDDELLPDYLETCFQVVREKPEFDIYAFNLYVVDPSGERRLNQDTALFQKQLTLTFEDLVSAPQIAGTAAFRRVWFDRIGGFDEDSYNEDYVFWLKALALGARHIYHPQISANYYLSENQKTSDHERVKADDLLILKKLSGSSILSPQQRRVVAREYTRRKRAIYLQKSLWGAVGRRLKELKNSAREAGRTQKGGGTS